MAAGLDINQKQCVVIEFLCCENESVEKIHNVKATGLFDFSIISIADDFQNVTTNMYKEYHDYSSIGMVFHGRATINKRNVSPENPKCWLKWHKDLYNWTVWQWEVFWWNLESYYSVWKSDESLSVCRAPGDLRSGVVLTEKYGRCGITVWLISNTINFICCILLHGHLIL